MTESLEFNEAAEAKGEDIVANQVEQEETKELGEDVTFHTMGPFETHDDLRGCAFHNRLGVWVTMDLRTNRWTLRCLRDHETTLPPADKE
jgi:hypothetical protein